MRLAFKKLFESGPDSAKTSQHSAAIQEVEGKTASAAEGCDTKTGVSVRPLSGAAIEIIQRQSRTNEYVFDYGHGRPVNSLRSYWLKLGMAKDVTPHVLRHSFASLGADLGLADSTIAGLIGHKQQSMTSRYLHLDKALVSAANVVAVETLRSMNQHKVAWPPDQQRFISTSFSPDWS